MNVGVEQIATKILKTCASSTSENTCSLDFNIIELVPLTFWGLFKKNIQQWKEVKVSYSPA